MNNPAIILGDAKSVLRLEPARMREPSRWNQLDSDIIVLCRKLDFGVWKWR